MNETEQLEIRIQDLERRLDSFQKIERFLLAHDIQILDGRSVQTGRKTGTKIATEADQKLGFFGKTPVVQPLGISDASGGTTVDAEARDSLNTLIAYMRDLGLIAT